MTRYFVYVDDLRVQLWVFCGNWMSFPIALQPKAGHDIPSLEGIAIIAKRASIETKLFSVQMQSTPRTYRYIAPHWLGDGLSAPLSPPGTFHGRISDILANLEIFDRKISHLLCRDSDSSAGRRWYHWRAIRDNFISKGTRMTDIIPGPQTPRNELSNSVHVAVLHHPTVV